MFFRGNIKLQKSFQLAAGYLTLIFVSLYFTPYLTEFLRRAAFLDLFVNGAYVSAGILFVIFSFYKYQIYNFRAYFFFSIILSLFLWEFVNARLLIERFHYVEYGLLYALWFRVVRHFVAREWWYAATLVLCFLFGLLDEWVQEFLPNRVFDWVDVWTNVEGCLFGLAVMAIFNHYRKDKRAKIKPAKF